MLQIFQFLDKEALSVIFPKREIKLVTNLNLLF